MVLNQISRKKISLLVIQSFSSFSDENINNTLQVIDIPGAYPRQDLWNSYREANY